MLCRLYQSDERNDKQYVKINSMIQEIIVGLLTFLQCGVGVSEAWSSTYRAKKYGSYYINKNHALSASAGGFARYSRVYAGVRNQYYYYYNYMFSWMKTNDYTAYKSSLSDSISVCRNYEANENGTFLGVFICPLPYEPAAHTYCCGELNAQYCCTFWDVPLNFAAVGVGCCIGVALLGILVYILVYLCAESRLGYSPLLPADRKPGLMTWVRTLSGRFSVKTSNSDVSDIIEEMEYEHHDDDADDDGVPSSWINMTPSIAMKQIRSPRPTATPTTDSPFAVPNT